MCIDIIEIRFGIADGQIKANFDGVMCLANINGMCIDIIEIRFGVADGQIKANFDGVMCLRHAHIFIFG